ncbi:MAG: type II toxin-antitoxin system VapC family toxin [Cyanobacteria bacterium K_Offshore_surface_m2_239]|nr:type II toxin-antitoxin system VapC family toxin [Cyanobacteria bacterium K_Offshore_surface_m2_239]
MKPSPGGFYLDTCLLISLFHNDSGYAAAEAWLVARPTAELWISHWVLLEFASATALRAAAASSRWRGWRGCRQR